MRGGTPAVGRRMENALLHWPAARIARLNYRAGAIAVASFLAINAVLIGLAVRAG